jgi:DNA-binding transcriptional LysR family regulator
MTVRMCRDLGGFEPDIRHRTNDATVAVALVARGLAVALLPALALEGVSGVELRPAGAARRSIFAATRATDAARPSIRALLAAIQAASAGAGAASSAA